MGPERWMTETVVGAARRLAVAGGGLWPTGAGLWLKGMAARVAVMVVCAVSCCAVAEGSAGSDGAQGAGKRWSAALSQGADVRVKGDFETYAVPEGYPYGRFEAPEFNVCVNGKGYCGLYEDLNHKAKQMVFGYFCFREGRRQRVEVVCKEPFDTFQILPAGADISDVVRTGPASLEFSIDRPSQNLTFVFDDGFQDRGVLHLFCNPVEDKPRKATYYFGPGYHDLRAGGKSGNIALSGDETVYIAPGAVVDGSVTNVGLTTGGVGGQGVLLNSDPGFRAINNSTCHGGYLRDVIVHSRCNGWQVVFHRCEGMNVEGIKVVSAFYRSNDGFDLTGCRDLRFDNCFIRAADDCVAIKGLEPKSTPLVDRPANTGLHFSRMQLWSDSNNAFGIGQEARAARYENISLTDSDVLFDWDDIFNSQRMCYQSSLNVCAMEGTTISNVLFDDIRLYKSMRVTCIGFIDDFYFGCITSDQSDPGEIRDVVFNNIRSYGETGWPNTDEIRMLVWHGNGGTPAKAIHDVEFRDVVLNGRRLESFDDERVIANDNHGSKLLYNISFTNTTGK